MEHAPLLVPSAKGHTDCKWPGCDLNGPSGPRIQAGVRAPKLHEGLIKRWCLCSGNVHTA